MDGHVKKERVGMKTQEQKIRAIVKCLRRIGCENYLFEHLDKPSRRNIAEVLRADAEHILEAIK